MALPSGRVLRPVPGNGGSPTYCNAECLLLQIKEANVYDPDEDPVTIGVYDDHAASARSDELEYIYLCKECAEERGVEVTHLSDTAAGQSEYCEGDCCRPNRTEEEEEYVD